MSKANQVNSDFIDGNYVLRASQIRALVESGDIKPVELATASGRGQWAISRFMSGTNSRGDLVEDLSDAVRKILKSRRAAAGSKG